MSNFNSNFSESKFGISLYFPISLSNNRSLHKSIRIFPLETPHKLKRIIIKRYHNFNFYINLLSHVIRENRIFSKKKGTSLFPPRYCWKRPWNVILWKSGSKVMAGKNSETCMWKPPILSKIYSKLNSLKFLTQDF